METIQKAVNIVGSQAELGRKVNVRASQVYKFLKNIQFPSIKTAQKIEKVTDGKVKAIDILHEKMQIKLKLEEKNIKE